MTQRSEARGLNQVHPVQKTPAVALGCAKGTKPPQAELREEQHPLPELLQKLVEIESPSGDVRASERIAELLTTEFSKIGCSCRKYPSAAGVHLVFDLPARHAAGGHAAVGADTSRAAASTQPGPIVFVGHTDTVWDVGTLGERIPFVRKGDRVCGPGIYDMKSGIVIMHEVLRKLNGAHPAVRVILVADEEVGSGTSRELLLREVADASCVLGFESPHPNGALKVGRYGSTVLRVSVRGKAAHAALRPEDGVHAIIELLSQIGHVQDIVSPAVESGRALCNVGVVQGGERANVIPDYAWCSIGLRFLDRDCEEQVLGEIMRLAAVNPKAKVRIETISHRPAWAARDCDTALAEQLSECARDAGVFDIAAAGQDAVGGLPEPAAARGAGDTNFIAQLSAPVVDGLGPRGGGAHALDEHIMVSSLWERVRLLCCFLQRFSVEPAKETV